MDLKQFNRFTYKIYIYCNLGTGHGVDQEQPTSANKKPRPVRIEQPLELSIEKCFASKSQQVQPDEPIPQPLPEEIQFAEDRSHRRVSKEETLETANPRIVIARLGNPEDELIVTAKERQTPNKHPHPYIETPEPHNRNPERQPVQSLAYQPIDEPAAADNRPRVYPEPEQISEFD